MFPGEPAQLAHLLMGVGTRAWQGAVHVPGHKDHGPSWCKRTGSCPHLAVLETGSFLMVSRPFGNWLFPDGMNKFNKFSK